MKARITFTLDSDLLNEMDTARGDVSRSKFLEKLLFLAWKTTSGERKAKEKREAEVPAGYV